MSEQLFFNKSRAPLGIPAREYHGPLGWEAGGRPTDVSARNVRNPAQVQFDQAGAALTGGGMLEGIAFPLPALQPDQFVAAMGRQYVRIDMAEFTPRKLADRQKLVGRVVGPVEAFLNLLDRWDISRDKGIVLLGEDDPALLDDLRSGAASLRKRDQRDRVRHLLKTYMILNRLLRDPSAERVWIRKQRAELAHRSVLDVMLGGAMEDLILAEEFTEDFANR